MRIYKYVFLFDLRKMMLIAEQRKPVDLSLRLAAASYLCLASLTHENDVISPVTEVLP